MITTILRFKKIKSNEGLRGATSHQYRFNLDTPNADSDKLKYNYRLFGTNNITADVNKKLSTLSKSIRKNAVLAMDGIISLSPEYFDDDNKIIEGRTNKKLSLFINGAMGYLKNEFGDNLINAVIHLDETSPHIHFTITPIQNGRLNCRDMFNRDGLKKYQRNYYQSMKSLIPEIEAPKFGSVATHQTLKAYYNEINESKDNLKDKLDQISKNILSDFKHGMTSSAECFFRPTIENTINKIEKQIGVKLKDDVKFELINKHNNDALMTFKTDKTFDRISNELKILMDDSIAKLVNDLGGVGVKDKIKSKIQL